jgi:hypothetical protein
MGVRSALGSVGDLPLLAAGVGSGVVSFFVVALLLRSDELRVLTRRFGL